MNGFKLNIEGKGINLITVDCQLSTVYSIYMRLRICLDDKILQE